MLFFFLNYYYKNTFDNAKQKTLTLLDSYTAINQRAR